MIILENNDVHTNDFLLEVSDTDVNWRYCPLATPSAFLVDTGDSCNECRVSWEPSESAEPWRHRPFDHSSEGGFRERKSRLETLQLEHLKSTPPQCSTRPDLKPRRKARNNWSHLVRFGEQQLQWSEIHVEHPSCFPLWKSQENTTTLSTNIRLSLSWAHVWYL